MRMLQWPAKYTTAHPCTLCLWATANTGCSILWMYLTSWMAAIHVPYIPHIHHTVLLTCRLFWKWFSKGYSLTGQSPILEGTGLPLRVVMLLRSRFLRSPFPTFWFPSSPFPTFSVSYVLVSYVGKYVSTSAHRYARMSGIQRSVPCVKHRWIHRALPVCITVRFTQDCFTLSCLHSWTCKAARRL